MEPSTPSVVTDRPDHRACANCARAKAKCVVSDVGNSACQRCSRLNKLCESNPIRAKTQPRKRKPLESTRIAKHRVEKLEEKLDDLVSLLKSGQEKANTSLVSPPESTVAALCGTSVEHPLRQAQDPHLDNSENQSTTWDYRLHNGGNVYSRFGIPSESAPLKPHLSRAEELPPYQFDEIDLGIEDPDILLSIFRDEMHSNFPFIVIPDSLSVSDLRRHRPALFTAVMAVTTRNSSQQTKIGNQLIQQLANRVYVRGERNMDLLLGCLTYAGWCYFHFFNVHRFTSLITTATTLIADLRLNTQNEFCAPHQLTQFFCAIRNSAGQEIPKEKERTVEERRSFLGYWYLKSVIAGFFRRLDRPPWSAYNEECCQVLEASNAHRDDITAVRLVRIQLLSDKILHSPWHMKQEISGSIAPPILYLKSLQIELNDLKKRQFSDLEKNDAILLSYQGLETLLYKPGLSKSPVFEALSSRDFNRVESLYACQQSVKRFFDIYLGADIRKSHCWPVSVFTLLTWSLGLSQLLCTFDHRDWDLEWARETMSFTGLLDILSQQNSKVKLALGFDPHTDIGEDLFSNLSRKMQWIKSVHEGKTCGPTGVVQSDNIQAPNTEMGDFMQGAEYVDLLEDEWMQDLLGSWDY